MPKSKTTETKRAVEPAALSWREFFERLGNGTLHGANDATGRRKAA